MNLQAQLDQFREDNPYDNDTQAKRLLASDNKPLILHVLALGFQAARQRQQHFVRDYIKNRGQAPAPAREVLRPGKTTGSVIRVKVKPSRRELNLYRKLIGDAWLIGNEQKLNEATKNDLMRAINREAASSEGHTKNATFYTNLRAKLEDGQTVADGFSDTELRAEIETVYGEFRKSEAA